jgi:hypothetical protein
MHSPSEVATERLTTYLDRFDSRVLDGGDCLVGVRLGGSTVVMHRDVDALFGQGRTDQSAQVFGSGGHHRRLSDQVGHDSALFLVTAMDCLSMGPRQRPT